MIKYQLKCECGHEFESWFSSSKEFDRLSKKKLLSCVCGVSNKITKQLHFFGYRCFLKNHIPAEVKTDGKGYQKGR